MKKFQSSEKATSPDAILLVVSRGLQDFIANALTSIARAGISNCVICIALPQNALPEAQAICGSEVQYLLLEDICHADYEWINSYHNYGKDAFTRFTASKWPAIKFLLEAGFQRVTYTDADIAWMQNPLPLLTNILKTYDIAIQTEGDDVFPPNFCTGFMSFRRSEFTIGLLNRLERAHDAMSQAGQAIDDQKAFNYVIRNSGGAIQKVFGLSELLFVNGRGVNTIALRDGQLDAIVHDRAKAMIFHANWTIGLEKKRLLLQRTGNWFIDQRLSARLACERGKAFVEAGKGKEALQEFLAARDEAPEDFEVLINLGECAFLQGDVETAYSVLLEASRQQPHSPRAFNDIGVVLERMGRHQEAIVYFEKIFAVAPDYPRVYTNLATLLHKANRSAEALALLERAPAQGPDVSQMDELRRQIAREQAR